MYTVETYDAFDAPSEREHLIQGEFATEEEAINCAKNIIIMYIVDAINSGKSVDEARHSFSLFGEVPMIFGQLQKKFDPFEFATKFCSLYENLD